MTSNNHPCAGLAAMYRSRGNVPLLSSAVYRRARDCGGVAGTANVPHIAIRIPKRVVLSLILSSAALTPLELSRLTRRERAGWLSTRSALLYIPIHSKGANRIREDKNGSVMLGPLGIDGKIAPD